MNKKLLMRLFMGSFVALMSIFAATNALEFEIVEKVQHSGINYDFRAARDPAFKAHRYKDAATGRVKDIDVAVQFKVLHAAGNIFQTAPFNNGLRLELAAPGTLALIAATDAAPGYKLYLVTSTLEPEIWHSFRVRISRAGRIRIELDGKKIVDAPDIELSYLVSDIAFGTGFSLTRTFDGEIKDASISYTIYRRNPFAKSPLVFIAMLTLFLANLVFLYLLSGATEDVKPS